MEPTSLLDIDHGPPSTSAPALPPLQPSDERLIQNDITVINNAFGAMATRATIEIDHLGATISKADEPSWDEALIEAALTLALSTGVGMVAERVAKGAASLLTQGAGARGAGSLGQSFITGFFKDSVKKGYDAGKSALSSAPQDNVEGFTYAQKMAAAVAYTAAQTNFVDQKSIQLTTLAQSRALRETCSEAKLTSAVSEHGHAVRDAWLSYLAQQKVGRVDKHTNMNDNTQRMLAHVDDPASWVGEAPSILSQSLGNAPGILMVTAGLPSIYGGFMTGSPRIIKSSVDGVNQEIRSEYEHKPLAENKVPRLISALVADGTQFTLRLDEGGTLAGPADPVAEMWLAKRAWVGNPGLVATMSHDDLVQRGLSLLIHELVTGTIRTRHGILPV